MTKRDILIFLSDVSNREIADYVMDKFEAGTEHLITEEQAQRFKEWLAAKLADPETDTEIPLSTSSDGIYSPYDP